MQLALANFLSTNCTFNLWMSKRAHDVFAIVNFILEGFLPFIFFLHAFDRKWGHNMLVLMFDPRF
jgi:hypothetical protein